MSDITETMTVKNGQAAVKTVTVAGKLSPKTSATDTIALVETSDGKQAALKVYNINGGGGAGGDGLPDQTGNAGKFLTTDGTTASWSDKPLVNNTEFYESFAVGGTVTSSRAISIGYKTKAHDLGTVSIGQNTEAKGISSTAIGNNVGTNALCAIQLGSTGGARATNSDANTFKVATNNGNFELMDADGKIPLERLTYVTNQIGDISTALTAILGE